jgi:hypothetical protein
VTIAVVMTVVLTIAVVMTVVLTIAVVTVRGGNERGGDAHGIHDPNHP